MKMAVSSILTFALSALIGATDGQASSKYGSSRMPAQNAEFCTVENGFASVVDFFGETAEASLQTLGEFMQTTSVLEQQSTKLLEKTLFRTGQSAEVSESNDLPSLKSQMSEIQTQAHNIIAQSPSTLRSYIRAALEEYFSTAWNLTFVEIYRSPLSANITELKENSFSSRRGSSRWSFG